MGTKRQRSHKFMNFLEFTKRTRRIPEHPHFLICGKKTVMLSLEIIAFI